MPSYLYTIQHADTDDAAVEVDLPDIGAAWSQAVISCGEAMAELDGDFGKNDEWLMSVSDATGQPLFEIRCTSKHFVRP
jgi:hypothetical protein